LLKTANPLIYKLLEVTLKPTSPFTPPFQCRKYPDLSKLADYPQPPA